jgi:hypothetical protein
MVLTPGGERPKENVHRVESGKAVRRKASGSYSMVSKEASDNLKTRSKTAGNLVLTPGGYRDPSLVHMIEPGHVLRITDGRFQKVHRSGKVVKEFGPVLRRGGERPLMPRNVFVPPEIVPTFGTGWITYADWSNNTGTPVSSFASTWVVPPEPATQSGQTIFLFNGIQNTSMIYQPVLQWGPSQAGGGNYWSIASWYADGQGGVAFYTPTVRVKTGDILVGVMTLTGQPGNNLFNYNCEFQGIANTSLPIERVDELTWCIETLEAYKITACSDYPDTDFTAFYSISLRTGNTDPTLDWTPEDKVTDCGQHAVVVSDANPGGEVDLYYRKAITKWQRWFELAEFVEILFGVTNDGGGVVILPNGEIIHIPPRGPDGDPILRQIAQGVTEMARGLAAREIARGSTNARAREAMNEAGLEMAAKGLEQALKAVQRELGN